MVRVGNQSGDHSKNGEGLNFHMGGAEADAAFVESNVRVVLFIDI